MTSAITNSAVTPEKALIGLILRWETDPKFQESIIRDMIAYGIDDCAFDDGDASRAWKAILTLHRANSVIDLVMVHRQDPETAIFCSEVIDCVVPRGEAAQHRFYAEEMMKTKWAKNNALLLSKLALDVSGLRPGDNFDSMQSELLNSIDRSCKSFFSDKTTAQHVKDVISDYVPVLQDRYEQRALGKPRGIPTGISTLDQVIHGFMPGGLYIVAARTSLGKTTLAINFANTALENDRSVLFFTNEMPNIQICEKQLSLRTGIFNSKLFSGSVEDKDIDRISEEVPKLESKKFYIDDKSGSVIETLTSGIKKHHLKHGLDMVVIDYIQQISTQDSGKFQSRVQELGYVSKELKRLAIDLKIPILCLAQVNRAAENSEDPPTLANIKDSGSIEQDADAVIFIHRDREKTDGECVLSIAKNRFGPSKDITCRVDLKVNKFY